MTDALPSVALGVFALGDLGLGDVDLRAGVFLGVGVFAFGEAAFAGVLRGGTFSVISGDSGAAATTGVGDLVFGDLPFGELFGDLAFARVETFRGDLTCGVPLGDGLGDSAAVV